MLERALGPLAGRWAWVRTVLAVQARFSEVHGGYLASAVTMTAFVSLFPLLLSLIGMIGLLSAGADNLSGEVVGRLGLTGASARLLEDSIRTAEESGKAASLLGLVGLLWTGLGLVAAFQFAFDAIWQISGRGMRDKLFGLAWLGGGGLLFLASFAVTAVVRLLPGPAWPFALAVTFAVDVALWLWTFKALTNRDIGWRPLLPGAVVGALGLEVLKVVGSFYVPRIVSSSSALYGSIGVVFAVLAWLLFFGRLVVYAAVINVVRWEQDHGTVTVEIELPDVPGAVPVTATRAGEAQAAPARGTTGRSKSR
ncbi:MAG: YihY/virulence factor BrkB family protein [Acidimicrobiales bacterium]